MDTYDMILMFRLRFNARNNRNSTCKCHANSNKKRKKENRLLHTTFYLRHIHTTHKSKTKEWTQTKTKKKKINCLILIWVDVSDEQIQFDAQNVCIELTVKYNIRLWMPMKAQITLSNKYDELVIFFVQKKKQKQIDYTANTAFSIYI